MYNIKLWEDERKANEKLLNVICLYPYTLGTASKKQRGLETPIDSTKCKTPQSSHNYSKSVA